MSTEHHWPVPVTAVGPITVGSMMWRLGPRWNLSVFIKAAFTFEFDGSISWVQAAPIRTKDAHIDGHPMRSLAAVCETAPFLPVADVVVSGYGYPDARKNRGSVRLAITRAGKMLLDKSVLVCGHRTSESSEPAPFEKVALIYENALGGLGFPANPVGTGAGSMNSGLPRVLHLQEPTTVPAAFGPIPASWPTRSERLRGTPRRQVERLMAELPDSIDLKYFQCAPDDQWLDELHGDESVLLGGMHPTQPQLGFTLPGTRALARVYGCAEAGLPEMLDLRPDLLQIDADERRCTLMWRGGVPVDDVELAKTATIIGALQQPGEEVCWPEPTHRYSRERATMNNLEEVRAAALNDDHRESFELTDRIESSRRGKTEEAWPPPQKGQPADESPFETTGDLDPNAVPDQTAALPFRNPAGSDEGK